MNFGVTPCKVYFDNEFYLPGLRFNFSGRTSIRLFSSRGPGPYGRTDPKVESKVLLISKSKDESYLIR